MSDQDLTVPGINPPSIVCNGLNDEVNKKPFLHTHFSQFGKVIGISTSRSNKYAIIHFSNADEAKLAKESGGHLHDDFPPVDIFFSAKSPTEGTSKRSLSRQSSTSTTTAPPSGGRVLRTRTSISKVSPLISTAAKLAFKPQPTSKLLTKTINSGADMATPFRLKRSSFPSELKKVEFPTIRNASWEEGEILSDPEAETQTDSTINTNEPETRDLKSFPTSTTDFPNVPLFGSADKNVFKFRLPRQSDPGIGFGAVKLIFGTTIPTGQLPSIQSVFGGAFATTAASKETKIIPSLFEIEPQLPKFPSRESTKPSFAFKLPVDPAPAAVPPISNLPRAEPKLEHELFRFGLSTPIMGAPIQAPVVTTPRIRREELQKQSETGTGVAVSSRRSKEIKPEGDANTDSEGSLTTTAELHDLRSVSADDKYRILESRDKILRQKNPKVKMRVEFAVRLVGTCPDMCPEKERYMREAQRQLSMYEFIHGRDYEVDHRAAVKAYSRSSADQEEPLSHELRSGPILDLTINYLLHNIIDRVENDGENLSEWYNFVWDRSRSIRKDITQQELCNLQAVSLMEKCTRFHIFCSSRLCELDRHSFDPKLNDENLMKCLQSLEHMYADLKLKGTDCPNEPEFRSYQILMNLNEGDILWEIQQKEEWVFNSCEVQLALKIHMAIFDKNFVSFFRLVRKASFMTACILHRYFYQVRLKALKTVIKAHSVPPKFKAVMSMPYIQEMLGFGPTMDKEFLSFCEDHGIACDTTTQKLTVGRRQIQVPEAPIVTREADLIDSKLQIPVSEAINGAPLGPNPLLSYFPKCSFDEEGYLKEESAIQKTILATEKKPIPPSVPPIPGLQPQKIMSTQKPLFQSMIGRSTEDWRSIPKPAFPMTMQSVSKGPVIEEVIVKVSQEKAAELLDHFIDLEVKEISKGAISTSLYQKQVEMEREFKVTQNWIASEIAQEIEMTVLKEMAIEVCTKELNLTKILDFVSAAIENDLHSTLISETSYEVCAETLAQKKQKYDESCKMASEKLKQVLLTYYLHLWKKNAEERKTERNYRAEKRLHDLVNFPPAMILPFSPEEMYSSWLNCTAINRKVTKFQERSSMLDVIERSMEITKSFTSWVNETTPSVLQYLLKPLKSELSKVIRTNNILKTQVSPVIFNIVLMSEFGSLDLLANFFWRSICKDCNATSDPNVIVFSLPTKGGHYFITFQKFDLKAVKERRSNFASASTAGVIIFLRTPSDNQFLKYLISYLNNCTSILVLNMSKQNERRIRKIMHVEDLQYHRLANYIGVMPAEDACLAEGISVLVKGIDWLGRTLPFVKELEPPLIYPRLEILLRTLITDVFPKYIAHTSCPSSLFEAHNKFIDKIFKFLIPNNCDNVLLLSPDNVTSLISEQWPEFKSILPPMESATGEELKDAFKILELPTTTNATPDLIGSIHQNVSPEKIQEFVRKYVIGLTSSTTSIILLMNQMDDLLTGVWTSASWKKLIIICQMYQLDCLESHLQNTTMRVVVNTTDLQSLQNPITDICNCTTRAVRKRFAGLTSTETSPLYKSARKSQEPLLDFVLSELQDLIREIKKEKEIPPHPWIITEEGQAANTTSAS